MHVVDLISIHVIVDGDRQRQICQIRPNSRSGGGGRIGLTLVTNIFPNSELCYLPLLGSDGILHEQYHCDGS